MKLKVKLNNKIFIFDEWQFNGNTWYRRLLSVNDISYNSNSFRIEIAVTYTNDRYLYFRHIFPGEPNDSLYVFKMIDKVADAIGGNPYFIYTPADDFEAAKNNCDRFFQTLIKLEAFF